VRRGGTGITYNEKTMGNGKRNDIPVSEERTAGAKKSRWGGSRVENPARGRKEDRQEGIDRRELNKTIPGSFHHNRLT